LRNSWRVWAVDFQFDVTTDGRPIKIASIIDEYTRHGSRAGRAVDADVSLVFVWDAFAVWRSLGCCVCDAHLSVSVASAP
jgi:hypothetical protein